MSIQSNFALVPLGDVVRFINGDRSTNYPKGNDYVDDGTPFISAADLEEGRIAYSKVRRISSGAYERLRSGKIQQGDVLFCLRGTIGKIAFVNSNEIGAIASSLVIVRATEKIDPRYLFFGLSSQAGQQAAIALNNGAAQPNLSVGELQKIHFPLPSAIIQRTIADILSSYDELIENSQRRIKILESMARALYREWFVNFRFPGHEFIPRVQSSLGKIPEGWEVKKLGDFVQFKSGFAFKSGTFTADGEHRLVTIKNVQDGSFSPECDSRMDELPERMPNYCVLDDGDILLSLTGNVGRVCLVFGGQFLLNQRVSKLVPAETLDRALTYCLFRETSMRVKLEQISNGVAQQNLSPIQAAQLECVYPPRELRQQFDQLADPMIQRIVQLYSTIQNLRRTRDLLLPRLLSGQIGVEAMAA